MIIRNMLSSDIEFAFQCTSSEGWEGETKEVFESFLAHHPAGCFVAERDSKKTGISVATPYKKNGFIGEVIIVKEMRGQGYGSKLFEHTVDYLKSLGVKNIYLDADLNAVSLYERFGFKKICRALRFTGTIQGKKNPVAEKISPKDLAEICLLDKILFADDRSFFLKRRYELFPHLCWIAKKGKSISGYIFGRPGRNVVSIAPVVVMDESAVTAKALIETMANETDNLTLYAGILENNKNAVDFFLSLKNFKQRTPGWYMVLGASDRLGNHEKLYSIGSAAKG